MRPILTIPGAAALVFSSSPMAAFVGVADDSGSDFFLEYEDEYNGLMGSSIFTNNIITFLPSSMVAQSVNGEGFNIANSTIQMRLTLKNTAGKFTSVEISEGGDFQ